MNPAVKTILSIVAIAVIVLGGWWLLSQKDAAQTEVENQENTATPNQQEENNNNEIGVDVNISVPKTHEVVYTDSGYSPATLTIKTGDMVRFENNSSRPTWPASAMHPTHTAYSGSTLQEHCPDNENDDFDACKNIEPGQSWDFTFKKTGEWAYHDHSNVGFFGKVIVE